MPVITLSLTDDSVAFVPDLNPTARYEVGPYLRKTWSPKDGFGSDIGAEFPTLRARLIFSVSADLLQSPSTRGLLALDKQKWTFTPLGLSGPLPANGGSPQPW